MSPILQQTHRRRSKPTRNQRPTQAGALCMLEQLIGCCSVILSTPPRTFTSSNFIFELYLLKMPLIFDNESSEIAMATACAVFERSEACDLPGLHYVQNVETKYYEHSKYQSNVSKQQQFKVNSSNTTTSKPILFKNRL